MSSPGQQISGNAESSGGGQSSLHDLFAMTDEQILEIEPEVHDVESALVAPARPEDRRPSLPAPSRLEARATNDPARAATEHPESEQAARELSASSQSARHTSAEPPQWLAERMADPHSGAEARELWDGAQQSRQEAAAFREVFAKPEDARTAAQRSRVLDDIDHAYFAGDSSQRAQLAASMLREDPAAFREMVFAGLRALEEAGKSAVANGVAADFVGAGLAPPARSPGRPTPSGASPAPANEAVMAHYAAFEQAANEDLERSVGATIDRTLDQALPHGNRSENGAMRARLAATIRQDVEKTLQGDRQLGEQVAQALASRRLDNESRAQVVRLIGARAQQLVPGAAKRVLSEWTQTTLDSHRGRTSRIENASSRRDVATASPEMRTAPSAVNSGRSTQNQTRERDNRASAHASASHGRKVDYRRISDEQILDS